MAAAVVPRCAVARRTRGAAVFNRFTIGVGIASLRRRRDLSADEARHLLAAGRARPRLFVGRADGLGGAFGALDASAFWLYAAAICWTVGYDTIYAQQDARDDAIVGIRSTARLFGAHARTACDLLRARRGVGAASLMRGRRADRLGRLGRLRRASRLAGLRIDGASPPVRWACSAPIATRACCCSPASRCRAGSAEFRPAGSCVRSAALVPSARSSRSCPSGSRNRPAAPPPEKPREDAGPHRVLGKSVTSAMARSIDMRPTSGQRRPAIATSAPRARRSPGAARQAVGIAGEQGREPRAAARGPLAVVAAGLARLDPARLLDRDLERHDRPHRIGAPGVGLPP